MKDPAPRRLDSRGERIMFEFFFARSNTFRSPDTILELGTGYSECHHHQKYRPIMSPKKKHFRYLLSFLYCFIFISLIRACVSNEILKRAALYAREEYSSKFSVGVL